MWLANITIIDSILNKNILLKYTFKIATYKSLLNDLKNIYNYCDKSEISFQFTYLGKKSLIDDLQKYILNRDEITIYIKDKAVKYVLTDPMGKKLYTSKNMSEVYNYYKYHNREIKHECLLFSKSFIKGCVKIKLLDVLDANQHNRCINRLIHRYNY